MKKITINTFALALMLLATDCYAQNRYEAVNKNTMEGTKVGVRDTKTGKDIIPAIYDNFGDCSEGKFPVVKNHKIGFVDTMNKLVVPILYADIVGYTDKARSFTKGINTKRYNSLD